MIDKLTPEQERAIDRYKKEFLAIGYDCNNLPDEEVVTIINELYAILQMKNPRVIIVDSPFSALKTYEILEREGEQAEITKEKLATIKEVSKTTKEQINNFWFGQHYSYFYGYIKYFYDMFGFKNKEKEKFDIALKLCKLHWLLPYETVCIVSRKPLYVKVDSEGKLNGIPAIEYANGDYVLPFVSGNGVTAEQLEMYKKFKENKNLAILEKNNADEAISNIAKLALRENNSI